MDRKKIQNWEGYEIDLDGNVWSNRSGLNQTGIFSQKWEKMKHMLNDLGYMVVGLRNVNKHKRARVHRLLAQNFIPNPDNKPFVCHKDGNRTHNCIPQKHCGCGGNLYWGTQKENMADRTRHGRGNEGEKHPMAKYSETQVRFWKKAMQLGVKPRALTEKFPEVNMKYLQGLRRGDFWKHLKTGWEKYFLTTPYGS